MLNSLSFHRIKDVEIKTYADEKWIDLVIRNGEGEKFTFCMFAAFTVDRNQLLRQLSDGAIRALYEAKDEHK